MKSRGVIQDEALGALLPINRGGVGITMGGGKTLIGLRHMDAHYNEYARFLVVAPKRSIFAEWQSQAVEHGLRHLIEHITFTTYLSLPKQDLDYDVIYLDECHSLLFTHDEWLSSYQGKIIGLSGTPPRYATSEKGKMVIKFCPIVYKYDTDEAIDDHILNDYKIIVHYLRLDVVKNIKVEHNGKSWFASERSTYDYWTNRIDGATSAKEAQIMRVMRMKAMMGFVSKEVLAHKLLMESTEKCLLFANTQEQADRLCGHSYHSNNPQSEENLVKFKVGEIRKLSAVLQLNEGVNIPQLKVGIIMHAYGNERKSPQRIGRLLRLNPDDVATINILCYIDTVDENWVNQALAGFDSDKITYK